MLNHARLVYGAQVLFISSIPFEAGAIKGDDRLARFYNEVLGRLSILLGGLADEDGCGFVDLFT